MKNTALLIISLLVYSGSVYGSSSMYSGKQGGESSRSPSLSTIESSSFSDDEKNEDVKKAEVLNNVDKTKSPDPMPVPALLESAVNDTLLAEAQLREHENNGGKVLQEVVERKAKGVAADEEPCGSTTTCYKQYALRRIKSESDMREKPQSDGESTKMLLIRLPKRSRKEQYAALAAQEESVEFPATNSYWCFCL
jgi:hypothetical protein